MRRIKKHKILQTIAQTGVIGIIRTPDVEKGISMGLAMIEGGVNVLEVSMTYPGAPDIVKGIAEQAKGKDFVLGTGTVSDSATARISILAGADFMVSQCLSEDVVKTCNRYGVPCSPGVGTVTEAMHALELGCDTVKAFPGNVLGPGFIKAIHGPVPQIEVIAVGGVSIDNLETWFKAGAYAVGLGSALTKVNGEDADYDTVLKKSREVVEKIAAIQANL